MIKEKRTISISYRKEIFLYSEKPARKLPTISMQEPWSAEADRGQIFCPWFGCVAAEPLVIRQLDSLSAAWREYFAEANCTNRELLKD